MKKYLKKYNRSEIMKKAWNLFHKSQRWVDKLSFAEGLRKSWKEAKESAKAEKNK